MMTKPFHERRRQQFLTERFFVASVAHIDEIRPELVALYNGPSGDLEDKRGWAYYVADDSYQRWSLRYTAGQPIEQLRVEFASVIDSYERYQRALAAHEEAPEMSPLGLDQLGDYEQALQLISLCYLLHRRDLLPRIAALIDPGYKGEDTLYEDLLAFHLEGRVELDEWYHEEPYTPLVQAMYEEDDHEAVRKLDEYVNHWYPAFKYIPWHDGHLRINGTDGDYFGYWAFEAGAVAYLCNIDDSKIAHMVYPKDLVAWARANEHLNTASSTSKDRLRCPAGQPCPQAGYWLTPAKADSRRLFKAGEIMPRFEGDYGETIWQWDERQ